MKIEKLAPLFFVMSALSVMTLSWFTRDGLLIPKEAAKTLGISLFLLGMAAFTWSVFHLRKAFLGDITPIRDELVTTGPYRWIRHPLYLSMIIILVGICLALRSLWGTIAFLLLFLPALVFRARLEEEALSRKFNRMWEQYVQRAKFLIPFLW